MEKLDIELFNNSFNGIIMIFIVEKLRKWFFDKIDIVKNIMYLVDDEIMMLIVLK